MNSKEREREMWIVYGAWVVCVSVIGLRSSTGGTIF